jgi:hypothetical protein
MDETIEIKGGMWGLMKSKFLFFRKDGILYDGTFIQMNEFAGITFYSERVAYAYSSVCHYTVAVGGANKSIVISFSEDGKKNEKRDLFCRIRDKMMTTVGTVVASSIVNRIVSGGSHAFVKAEFKKEGVYCVDSAFVLPAVYFPEISIKGKTIFVPYDRITCEYDSGIIKLSDRLHTRLNCRINPREIRNAVLIPDIVDYFSKNHSRL